MVAKAFGKAQIGKDKLDNKGDKVEIDVLE